MLTLRQLFLQNLGQTSDSPLMLEIEHAKGIYMYDNTGKKYIDLISGVSVSNVGHGHPKVVEAVKNQVDKYMHLMVYGEYIQSPQVLLAEKLVGLLPESLSSVYLVNSGSEATEGALKLAKRFTGRGEIISFHNAYHGSTHGALSVMGDSEFTKPFQPLLPSVRFLNFNAIEDLKEITEKTACVIVEPIQGEAGIIMPVNNFLQELRKRCNETGTLLIFDEIQTGFGRTGKLFAFEKFNVVPDILLIAKGFGGGMPIGAFVAPKHIMDSFKTNPVLGHITTFGGHPVSCAAALASLEVIMENNYIAEAEAKGDLFRKMLRSHSLIQGFRGTGLFQAVELPSFEILLNFIKSAVREGVVSDWFIFCNDHFRISPPITITEAEIEETSYLILRALDNVKKLL